MYGLKKIEVDISNNHFKSNEGILFDASSEILKVFPGGIKDFTIRGNIQEIEEKAFYECILLETLNFQNVNQLESFGEYTFGGCLKLSSIRIPSCVGQIYPYCFSKCTNLENVTFSDGSLLTTLSSGVFDQCTSLKSIQFGKQSSLTHIENEAFSRCSSLEEFDFPSSLIHIGVGSFRDCLKLKSAHLNETKVSTIGKECFKGCINLLEVTLPISLNKLGSASFNDCTSLRSIFYCGTEQFAEPSLSGVIADADVSITYRYDKFGGLSVNRILDKDCFFPTIVFTSQKESIPPIVIASFISLAGEC